VAGPTLTAAGFTIQTVDEIAAETLSALRANASEPGLLAAPGSPLGTIIASLAERERLLQELGQSVWSAVSVDASGVSLDRTGQPFGVTRTAATQSTVTIPVTNTSGAPITITAGSQLENSDTGDQFAVVTAVTIGAAVTSSIDAQAIIAGSVPVVAATTWAWITAGYSAVTFGSNTDAQMRARWLVSLANPGAGTLPSILAALLSLDGMTAARVLENTSGSLGITTPEIVSTLPGHSFVALTRSTATSAAIAAAIWATKPVGIASFGANSATVTDSQGIAHTVYWQASTADAVAVVVTVTGSDASYDAAITAAITAYFDDLDLGADIIAFRIGCAVLDAAGPNATLVATDIAGGGAGVDYAVAWNQYGSLSGAPTINHI
jgi:hypothetical protein